MPPIAPEQVLSDSEILVDLTTTLQNDPTTPESEDYDLLIQGSDRRYPAIVKRRKHRGKGATIWTISRHDLKGRLNPAYDDYAGVVEAYLERRQQRKALASSRPTTDNSQATREAWVDKAIQGVVEGRSNERD